MQCLADVPAPSFGGGIVSDACDAMVTVTHIGDATNGVCPTIITRTWRATDDSGNTNDCAQIITVRDTIPPVVSCSLNRTVKSASTNGANVSFTVATLPRVRAIYFASLDLKRASVSGSAR